MQGSRKEAVAEAQLWVKAAHLENPTSRQQASESTSACHLDNRALRGKLFRLPYEWQTMKGCIPWYLLVKFLHGLQTTDNCALFLRPWWFHLLANTEEWGAIWGSPPKTLFLQKWENRIERHAFKSTTSSKEKEVNVYKSQNVNHRNCCLNPCLGTVLSLTGHLIFEILSGLNAKPLDLRQSRDRTWPHLLSRN